VPQQRAHAHGGAGARRQVQRGEALVVQKVHVGQQRVVVVVARAAVPEEHLQDVRAAGGGGGVQAVLPRQRVDDGRARAGVQREGAADDVALRRRRPLLAAAAAATASSTTGRTTDLARGLQQPPLLRAHLHESLRLRLGHRGGGAALFQPSHIVLWLLASDIGRSALTARGLLSAYRTRAVSAEPPRCPHTKVSQVKLHRSAQEQCKCLLCHELLIMTLQRSPLLSSVGAPTAQKQNTNAYVRT